jgi:hypothetical protein
MGGYMATESRAYVEKRKRLSGVFFETALPNEYLVQVGKRAVTPTLGGRQFRLFRKFLRVPGSVETLYFKTDNANLDYQGVGIEGYASWRIDPQKPEVAVATLDFFDEDDPMRDTNEKLVTICVEAVRHVIANMTIDDALKKKDEIGENLKAQLRKFEDRWGIIFDQVGIDKVRIMSANLFEDLQAEYRDHLRLNVSTAKIQTDRKIAREENLQRQETESERLATDRQLSLVASENKAEVERDRIERDQALYEQDRLIKEDRYRKDSEFERVQKENEHDTRLLAEQHAQDEQEATFQTQQKEQQLKADLQGLQQRVLEAEQTIEKLRATIQTEKLQPLRERRLIEQTHTPENLSHQLLTVLPQIYASLDIDNYSVMNTGDGDISPVGKIMQEVIGLLRANNLEDLLRRATGGSTSNGTKA